MCVRVYMRACVCVRACVRACEALLISKLGTALLSTLLIDQTLSCAPPGGACFPCVQQHLSYVTSSGHVSVV